MAEKAGVPNSLEERRAKYLEQKVADLLKIALPTATIRNSTKWRLSVVEYETDHFAMIDRTAIIVEDKSAALTLQGLQSSGG